VAAAAAASKSLRQEETQGEDRPKVEVDNTKQ